MRITEFDTIYHINKDFYMSKIDQIPSNAEFGKFASMNMKLVWLARTKPDIVLESHKLHK